MIIIASKTLPSLCDKLVVAKCDVLIMHRRLIHYCRNGEPFLAEVLSNLRITLVDPAFTYILIRENMIRSKAVEK